MIDGTETLIFDLDGTLVDSSGFEDECYVAALREALGDLRIDPDWSRYRHVTDAGILGQIVEENGVPEPGKIVREARAAFGRRVADYLATGGSCNAIPGAASTMTHLAGAGFRFGIATGGWSHTARMKLERAGIEVEGLVLSSCDDAPDRIGIMSDCLGRLGGTPGNVVYFGDGPWDVAASAKLGWRFIGVGERLRGKCAEWIADFLDPNWPLSPGSSKVANEAVSVGFDPQPRLRGELVTLEPLRSEHFQPLYAVAADPEIWAQHPVSNRHEESTFRSFFRESLESGGALAIRDARTTEIVGSTRFHGLDSERREVEIGWTFLGRAYWGGAHNREAKRLMLVHAFRFVQRVVFLVDPANRRSRRAVEKIGGVRAGSRRNGAGVLNDLYEIRAEWFGRE
jgi:RimJ/RimL family protein N-acetyltransferase/phosphoglycolate phosphatase-like HAD superfamily hydrolase